MQYTLNGVAGTHQFVHDFVGQSFLSNANVWSLSQEVRAYADAGTVIRILASRCGTSASGPGSPRVGERRKSGPLCCGAGQGPSGPWPCPAPQGGLRVGYARLSLATVVAGALTTRTRRP